MDTIIRAFWWGHGQGEKKLHLLNWESIYQPKRKGGLGPKKFGPMNQAMHTCKAILETELKS